MRVRYDGPFDSVDVPAAGITVERGDTVEVTDEIGESLVEQADWSKASAKKEREG